MTCMYQFYVISITNSYFFDYRPLMKCEKCGNVEFKNKIPKVIDTNIIKGKAAIMNLLNE